MIKNAEYVFMSYGITIVVILAYTVSIMYKLRKIIIKQKHLGEESHNE